MFVMTGPHLAWILRSGLATRLAVISLFGSVPSFDRIRFRTHEKARRHEEARMKRATIGFMRSAGFPLHANRAGIDDYPL